MSLVRVHVGGMAIDSQTQSHVVILSEEQGDRFLPIWIGSAEAYSIAMALGGVVAPRPNSHDLVANMVDALGGTLTKVVISELHDSTFFAQIFVRRANELVCLDARPSDSIALALRAKAALYISDAVPMYSKDQMHGGESSDVDELRRKLKEIRPEEFGHYEL